MFLKSRVRADDNIMGLSCYQHHDLVAGGSKNDGLIEAQPGQVEDKTMEEE